MCISMVQAGEARLALPVRQEGQVIVGACAVE